MMTLTSSYIVFAKPLKIQIKGFPHVTKGYNAIKQTAIGQKYEFDRIKQCRDKLSPLEFYKSNENKNKFSFTNLVPMDPNGSKRLQ